MNGPAAVYRQAAKNPRRTRTLAFDELPSTTRERLERALANGAPEALLAAPSGMAPLARNAAIATGVVATCALGVVFQSGFGDTSSARSIQPTAYGALYAALLAAVGASILAAAAIRRGQRGAVFPSGRYLFPLDLVEVERGTLRVTSLDTLRSVAAHGAKVLVTFEDGYSVAFWPPKGEGSTSAAEDASRAIQLAAGLTSPADDVRLERVDPLFEVRRTEEWRTGAPASSKAPSAGTTRPRPTRRLGAALAIGGAASVALGFAIVPVRNRLSDDIMFDLASKRPTPQMVTEDLFEYLAHGSRHRDEAFKTVVRLAAHDSRQLEHYARRTDAMGDLAGDALVELAGSEPLDLARIVRQRSAKSDVADERLFALARRLDDVETYGTYLEVGRLHVDEAKALRDEAAFHAAMTSPQVGRACRFVRDHQGSPHEDEAWARIRKMFGDAGAALDAKPRSAEAATFGHALLDALLERADPRVTIDVAFLPATALFDADYGAMKRKYGDRLLSATARFSHESLEPVKKDIRGYIATWLGETFKGGTAEGVAPSSSDDPEEPRPRFTVRIETVVDGISTWKKTRGSMGEITYVTPLVGFRVEVTGTVRREGGDVTLRWARHFEDDTAGKMLTKDFRGEARQLPDLLDDVYQPFLTVVPQRIALSFRETL